jgi:hypothetical protein
MPEIAGYSSTRVPRRPKKADYVLARQFRQPLPKMCRRWLALRAATSTRAKT